MYLSLLIVGTFVNVPFKLFCRLIIQLEILGFIFSSLNWLCAMLKCGSTSCKRKITVIENRCFAKISTDHSRELFEIITIADIEKYSKQEMKYLRANVLLISFYVDMRLYLEEIAGAYSLEFVLFTSKSRMQNLDMGWDDFLLIDK